MWTPPETPLQQIRQPGPYARILILKRRLRRPRRRNVLFIDKNSGLVVWLRLQSVHYVLHSKVVNLLRSARLRVFQLDALTNPRHELGFIICFVSGSVDHPQVSHAIQCGPVQVPPLAHENG
jgi:hypothetical protein